MLEVIDYPHVHDLNKLYNLLPSDWKVGHDMFDEFEKMTFMVVSSRYHDHNSGSELTKADADWAVSLAKDVFNKVKNKFATRGL